MMRCTQCHHELPDGSLFCDACGASLVPGAVDPSNGTPRPMPHLGGVDPASLARVQPFANSNGAAQANGLGGQARMRHTMTPQLPRSDVTPAMPVPTQPREQASGAAAYKAQAEKQVHSTGAATKSRIRLRLMNGKAFELAGKVDYVIGRRDPNMPAPDVDLTDWNGAASGVSRQHAAIHVSAEGVSIEDLESLNETIRNGYRLLPHQRYPLQDGDELRLGSISLLVVIS